MGIGSYVTLSAALAEFANDLDWVAQVVQKGKCLTAVDENLAMLKAVVARMGDLKLLRLQMETTENEFADAQWCNGDETSGDIGENIVAMEDTECNLGRVSRKTGNHGILELNKVCDKPSKQEANAESELSKVKGSLSNSKDAFEQDSCKAAKMEGKSGVPPGFHESENYRMTASDQGLFGAHGLSWKIEDSSRNWQRAGKETFANKGVLKKPFETQGQWCPVKCFRCGLRGHKANNCVVKCFRCGKTGHGVFSCSDKAAERQQGLNHRTSIYEQWSDQYDMVFYDSEEMRAREKQFMEEEHAQVGQHHLKKFGKKSNGIDINDGQQVDSSDGKIRRLFEAASQARPGKWPERKNEESEIEYLERLIESAEELK